MSALDFALRLEGLPEPVIAELDKQLPALERLAATVKQLEPMLTPILPIVNKAWPDIVAITPLVQSLIAFVKEKESS